MSQQNCSITCHHADEVVASKTKIKAIESSLKSIDDKLEKTRKDNHDRVTNMFNTYAEFHNDIYKEIAKTNANVSDLRHNVNTLSDFVKDFKVFVKEATGTFEGIKEFIDKQDAKNTLKNQIFKYVLQLATFALTIIGIIKYLGN